MRGGTRDGDAGAVRGVVPALRVGRRRGSLVRGGRRAALSRSFGAGDLARLESFWSCVAPPSVSCCGVRAFTASVGCEPREPWGDLVDGWDWCGGDPDDCRRARAACAVAVALQAAVTSR